MITQVYGKRVNIRAQHELDTTRLLSYYFNLERVVMTEDINIKCLSHCESHIKIYNGTRFGLYCNELSYIVESQVILYRKVVRFFLCFLWRSLANSSLKSIIVRISVVEIRNIYLHDEDIFFTSLKFETSSFYPTLPTSRWQEFSLTFQANYGTRFMKEKI